MYAHEFGRHNFPYDINQRQHGFRGNSHTKVNSDYVCSEEIDCNENVSFKLLIEIEISIEPKHV